MKIKLFDIFEAGRRYPVETLLCFLLAVMNFDVFSKYQESYTLLFPMTFSVSYIFNILTRDKSWRWLYYIAPAATVALNLIFIWKFSDSLYALLMVLPILLFILATTSRDNEHFAKSMLNVQLSLLITQFFMGITLGLLSAIIYSITELYDMSFQSEFFVYIVAPICGLLSPMILFYLLDGALFKIEKSTVVSILMNYILSPAILIYAIVLYSYFMLILVSWELPSGGVAWMVFALAIFFLLGKAMNLLSEKVRFGWMYKYYTMIMLPLLVMFWVGVARRISDYGLTESRIYLLIFGGVMTLTALAMVSRKYGRYYYVVSALAGITLLISLVPSVHPENIAIRYHVKRIEQLGAKLDLMNEDQTMNLNAVQRFNHTVEALQDVKDLHSSMDYIYDNRRVSYCEPYIEQLGLTDRDKFYEATTNLRVELNESGDIEFLRTIYYTVGYYNEKVPFDFEIRPDFKNLFLPKFGVGSNCDYNVDTGIMTITNDKDLNFSFDLKSYVNEKISQAYPQSTMALTDEEIDALNLCTYETETYMVIMSFNLSYDREDNTYNPTQSTNVNAVLY